MSMYKFSWLCMELRDGREGQRDSLAGEGTFHQAWSLCLITGKERTDFHSCPLATTYTLMLHSPTRGHTHCNPDDTPILETSAVLTTILLLNSSDNKMLDLEESLTPRKLYSRTSGVSLAVGWG